MFARSPGLEIVGQSQSLAAVSRPQRGFGLDQKQLDLGSTRLGGGRK
jgi:hypothetical protein